MSTNGPARTFVALYPSAAQRDAIRDLVARVAGVAGSLRPVRPESAHLTLAFLGDVPRERLSDVAGAVAAAAARHAPFPVAYRGVGAFPDVTRARVVWLGVAGGRDPLLGLAGDVRERLAAAGFAADDRPFRPHLTLGRVPARGSTAAARARLADLLERLDPMEGTGAALVREVAVVTSRLGPEGARHALLDRAPLGG